MGSVVGSVFKRFQSDEEAEEEEYDPARPMIGTVASKVHIRGRRLVYRTKSCSKQLH